MNILNEGIPSIIVPNNWEELAAADFIEKNEFGTAIRKPPADILEDEIYTSIGKILESTQIYQRLAKLKTEMKAWNGGAERIAFKIIESLARTNSQTVSVNR